MILAELIRANGKKVSKIFVFWYTFILFRVNLIFLKFFLFPHFLNEKRCKIIRIKQLLLIIIYKATMSCA